MSEHRHNHRDGSNRWFAVVVGSVAVGTTAAALLMGLSAITLGVIGALSVLLGLLGWIRSRPRRRTAGLPQTVLFEGLGLGLAALMVLQLVPYGNDHSNRPVVGEPAWATTRTRELMVRACYDCHSNQVDWPWYSNVAPVSWWVVDHVREGRDAVNYSEFTVQRGEAGETVGSIVEGEMPPAYYTLAGLHANARLTDAELNELVAGLRATPGLSEGGGERARDDDDD